MRDYWFFQKDIASFTLQTNVSFAISSIRVYAGQAVSEFVS